MLLEIWDFQDPPGDPNRAGALLNPAHGRLLRPEDPPC